MMTSKNTVESPRRRIALNRAQTWLNMRISKGDWLPGERLPTLDSLAAGASVSRQTMWHAVRACIDRKLLVASRGSGIRAAGKSEGPQPSHLSWEDIARRITSSIYNGEYPPGTLLPPLTKLQMRFHVCFRTMQKAFSALVDRETLVRTGARYTVAGTLAMRPSMEVILLVEKDVENDRTRNLISTSEQIAPKEGFSLIRDEYVLDKPIVNKKRRAYADRELVAGFILDCWGLSSLERMRSFLDLVWLLHRSKKPVAIIDELGSLKLPEPYRSSKRIHLFTIAGTLAGIDAGRYLLSRNHSRIAFVTAMHDTLWSQKRYEGVRQAFVEAGKAPDSVTLCKTDPIPIANAIVCAIAKLTRKEIELLFRDTMSNDGLENLIADKEQAAHMVQVSPFDTAQTRAMMKAAINLMKNPHYRLRMIPARTRIIEQISLNYHHHFMKPFFEKLAADHSITAWVTVADVIGRVAAAFVQNRSEGNPRKRIAVIAFDNSESSVMEKLTSYDFDMANIFRQGLGFISGRSIGFQKAGVTECRGIFCQRESG